MKTKTENKTIGIIGGMGPLATADLYRKIVMSTDAACDQEHIHTLIDSNTNIPDRTAALLCGAESPVEEMVKSARLLKKPVPDCSSCPATRLTTFTPRCRTLCRYRSCT